jgi:zinc-binding alcohol dehydrogenase/oxidoreductase
MKALQITDHPTEKLQIRELSKPELKDGEALVRMKAAALNRRDEWIREGKYPRIKPFSTLGSDGCGIVEEVADEEDQVWLGKEVIINPNINWGHHPEVQSPTYEILGMPSNGTFAEYIAVPMNRLQEKPAHLTFEEGACFSLAALTAYRAVFTQGELKRNQTICVSGIGGGVALFAFQFARAIGSKVYVTSGSTAKIQKAKEMGAVDGVNYTEGDWVSKLLTLTGGLNLVIDSAGGEAFAAFIKTIKPAGKLVFYGASQGLPEKLDLHRIFFRQIRIQGSTMGNDEEFKQMLHFADRYQLKPVIDSVRPFDQIISAFDDMQHQRQFGKLVVSF